MYMLLVKHSRSIIVGLDSNLLKGKAKLYEKLEIKMRKIESEKKRERKKGGKRKGGYTLLPFQAW